MTINDKRRTPLQPKDPAAVMREHGIHGDRSTVSTSSGAMRRLVMVPLAKIRPGRYQKRENIDGEKYAQLKEQIKKLGFNFIAILCKDPDDPEYYNLMMGGHLRVQAAIELGINEVSAIIREYDRSLMGQGTYFENNGRQPLTLIEEGLLFQQFQEDEGWTQEEIATNLIVPGGRSHVALCMLTITAPPDIQEMLRQDPKRGNRCFTYLQQLNVLGDERAIELRAPIIQDFLSHTISTDEVEVVVKRILARERGGQTQEAKIEVTPVFKRQTRITSTMKSFRRWEKEIGDEVPSVEEREALSRLLAKIESVLQRG